MKKALSIRALLTFWLLVSITIFVNLVILSHLVLTYHHVRDNLDQHLLSVSHKLKHSLTQQQSDNSHHIKNFLYLTSPYLQAHILTQRNNDVMLQLQIWKNDRLIYRSPDAPDQPLAPINWLKKHSHNGLLTYQNWRISSFEMPSKNWTVLIAEPLNARHAIWKDLALNMLWSILACFPLLVIALIYIVKYSLRSIDRLVSAIQSRAPDKLDPLTPDTRPKELHPLIDTINHLFSRLEEAFKREKQFTSDAAHELRTPLAALKTHTQIALRAQTAEDRRDAMLKVLSGVNRSTHVIDQLLTLCRVEPGATPFTLKSLILEKEASEIAMLLAPAAVAKEVELELLSTQKETYIMGDRTTIGILLRNLVDNAIRYSESHTLVKIQIEEQPDCIFLRVIDQGEGMPAEVRDKIFQRFYRKLGENRPQGTGLGLNIVKKITELHNASIEVHAPEDGKGTEFRIIFPKIKQ